MRLQVNEIGGFIAIQYSNLIFLHTKNDKYYGGTTQITGGPIRKMTT